MDKREDAGEFYPGGKVVSTRPVPAESNYFDGAEYVQSYGAQSRPALLFKHGTTVLVAVDATPFVKDGIVSNVEISGGNLVITFNTDAGKQPISIPLTDIFNPSNYYDKTAADDRFASKAEAEALRTAVAGKQDALSSQQLANIAAVPNKADAADLRYSLNTATVTPGSSVWTANHSQIYDMFGELVDVSLPEWGTYPTSEGETTGWFWPNPDVVHELLSEDESATSLTAYWQGYNGEESISYTINFTKTTSPATVTNVKDRAVNAIALSGDATLTLPLQVGGKSRDFYLSVSNSGSSNATITVSRAVLVDSAMNAVTLVAKPSAITTWRLTEMVNGSGTLIPATFIVTGANQLSSSDVIDPATATASGKAADALATKNALAAKQAALSSAQLSNIAAVPNKADAADLPYSFNAATVGSGTTPTVTGLANRAINTATLGSTVTAATVTLPAAVSGRSRDFFIDLTIEATDAPTLTFIDPATSTTATIAFGADSLADIAPGNNLVLFTEIAPTNFLVSVKHEDVQ